MVNYKNRIVDSGMANPKEIIANPMNWRKHPEIQKKAMEEVLNNVGWVQDVIINRTTGRLVDGHLRVEMAIQNNETEIPVKYVELTEEEEKSVLATFDPISAMATADKEALEKLVDSLDTDMDMSKFEIDGKSFDELGVVKENPYSENLNIPQYEITGELPSFDKMVNTDKSDAFIEEIKKSNVSMEEKDFLIKAAYRHNVFNYKNIAEYYAHASAEMQRLMEKSALVIIDIDNAIANGYVKLSESIADLIEEENEE